MTSLKRDTLLKAIALVNDASGTQAVFRTIENQLINRIRALDDIIDDTRLDREFSIVDQFRDDVQALVDMLESDGSYYDAEQRCYFTSPKRIAHEMIESGVSWVTTTKVREAQKVKRG